MWASVRARPRTDAPTLLIICANEGTSSEPQDIILMSLCVLFLEETKERNPHLASDKSYRTH